MKGKKLSISAKMLIGMVLGIIVGFIGNAMGINVAVIKPFGTLFVNLLKMCMVPVVFASIVLSVAEVDDIKKFGRIAGRTFIYYCLTTVAAATISVCYTSTIKPGLGFAGATDTGAIERAMPTLADTLLSIVPTNIVQALANAHLLSIIFFSVMFGISLSLIGDAKTPVVDFFKSFNEAILKLISICLNYAPFGVFSLMAAMASTYGMEIFSTLGKFLITDYLGFITQMIVVYSIVLLPCKINIFKFISRAKEAIIMAFTSTSSAATVPVELRISETHLGVPKNVGGFCYPFGATVNQNGTAINVTCCVLFTAQVYGYNFSATDLITIIGLALISSIGCAGVPAGGTIFTLMILSQFGIPTDVFGFIIAAYTLVDMGSTAMNITGDMACAVLACKKEGYLDEKVWAKDYDLEAAIAAAGEE